MVRCCRNFDGVVEELADGADMGIGKGRAKAPWLNVGFEYQVSTRVHKLVDI